MLSSRCLAGKRGVPKRTLGFTLLELLIAIAIFSFLATGCYQLFRSVTRTHETIAKVWQENNAIQRALLVMNKDFAQIVPRPIRNDFGDREPAFAANDEGEVLFTRGGWRNFLNEPRSHLQRIGYQLKGGQLLRRSWRILDRAPETEYHEQVLLDNVKSFTLGFLDNNRVWHKSWPPENNSQNQSQNQSAGQNRSFSLLPAAISYTITHERLGEVSQLIPGSSYQPDGNYSSGSRAGANTSGSDSNPSENRGGNTDSNGRRDEK